MTNLLEYIKNDKKHPFNNILSINDDLKTINSQIKDKKITIYSEDRFFGEELAREIFLLTNDRTKINLKDYILENKDENGNRTDVIFKKTIKNKSVIFGIQEYKNVDLNSYTKKSGEIDKIKNDAFNQIKDKYIQGLISENQQDVDIYTSVILIDIQKIIEKPNLIDLFNNYIGEKMTPFESLSSFGIYIENKIYSIYKKEFIKTTYHNIPVVEKWDRQNPKELKIGNNFIFTRSVEDSYFTITSTSAMGVSNVRERINPFFSLSKKNLTFDFLNTFIKGFKDNNIKIMNVHSEVKTFIFLEQVTITFYTDDELYITTTNGALINGQQSTHVPYFLITLINKKNEDCSKNELKFKKEIEEILNKNNIKTENEKIEFINYIKKCSFNYQIESIITEENIRDIAISRNTSLPVSKLENLMANIYGAKYKFLSYKINEKIQILYSYPNSSKKYTKLSNSNTSIMEVPFIYSYLKDFDKKSIEDNFLIFKSLNFNSLKEFEKDKTNKIINTIINAKFSKSDNLNSKQTELKKLEEKIELLEDMNQKTEEINVKINTLKDEKNSLNINIREIENNLVKNFSIDTNNLDKIINYLDKYELVYDILNQFLDEKKQKILDKDFKSLIFLILKSISKKRNVKINTLNEELLKKEVINFINNLLEIKLNYNFNWISDLGNFKSKELLNNKNIVNVNDINDIITLKELIDKIIDYKEIKNDIQ